MNRVHGSHKLRFCKDSKVNLLLSEAQTSNWYKSGYSTHESLNPEHLSVTRLRGICIDPAVIVCCIRIRNEAGSTVHCIKFWKICSNIFFHKLLCINTQPVHSARRENLALQYREKFPKEIESIWRTEKNGPFCGTQHKKCWAGTTTKTKPRTHSSAQDTQSRSVFWSVLAQTSVCASMWARTVKPVFSRTEQYICSQSWWDDPSVEAAESNQADWSEHVHRQVLQFAFFVSAGSHRLLRSAAAALQATSRVPTINVLKLWPEERLNLLDDFLWTRVFYCLLSLTKLDCELKSFCLSI